MERSVFVTLIAASAALADAAPFHNGGGNAYVKYAAWSIVKDTGRTWISKLVDGRNLSDCDAYRQGQKPTHYICDGERTHVSDQSLADCRDACGATSSCSVVQWQGLLANSFSAQKPGRCFLYESCDHARKYDTALAQEFCMDITHSTSSVEVAIGKVSKHPQNPLLVQDKPWDARWDNGYPNIEYAPGAPGGTFQVWYGGFITCSDCDKGQGKQRVNAWHYANSSDGLRWTKPELGIMDLSKVKHATPAMVAAGTRNNVLMSPSDGMGMMRDAHEKNTSRLYKAFGTGCFGEGGNTGCTSGTGFSKDGLHWADSQQISWPSPHRWDDHQNLFFDEDAQRYILTTRDIEEPGRSIAIAEGAVDGSFGGWSNPALTMEGTNDHQLYSQVTWRYYNIYLGIVMVFNTQDPSTVGTVQCRLAWSHSATSGWKWVSAGGLTGPEMIPISGVDSHTFDSHICFAGHKPVVVNDDVWLYYMGGNGPHNGARNSSMALATLRMDGFAGLRGGPDEETLTTMPLQVVGDTLVITVDILGAGGFACLGVVGNPKLSASSCKHITSNATNAPIEFVGGSTLESLIGANVTLNIVLKDAIVYTLGFKKDEERLVDTVLV